MQHAALLRAETSYLTFEPLWSFGMNVSLDVCWKGDIWESDLPTAAPLSLLITNTARCSRPVTRGPLLPECESCQHLQLLILPPFVSPP